MWRFFCSILSAWGLCLSLCTGVWAAGEPGAHSPVHGQMHTHWMAPVQAAQRKNPVPYSRESIERGAYLYEKSCAACHGTDGRGSGPAAAALSKRPSDLIRSTLHHSDGDIAWKIETGNPPMPKFKNTLSQQDIWRLVNYLRSLTLKTP